MSKGSKGKKAMTRHAHRYCPFDPETLKYACGTRSKIHCGGRWWANRYPMSLVAKNEITERITRLRGMARVTARRMAGVKK